MNRFVALLRGINVSGRNRVPMAELRPLCETLGWSAVRTYIQSGNVVFEAKGDGSALEAALEKAIERHFGLSIPVIVRSAGQWPIYVNANPFPHEAETGPNRLMLCLSKARPAGDCAEALQARAKDGEQVRLAGDALYIHFPAGSGSSKLSPSLIDRLVGSPVTARNWRTMLTLQEMLAA